MYFVCTCAFAPPMVISVCIRTHAYTHIQRKYISSRGYLGMYTYTYIYTYTKKVNPRIRNRNTFPITYQDRQDRQIETHRGGGGGNLNLLRDLGGRDSLHGGAGRLCVVGAVPLQANLLRRRLLRAD